MKYFHAVQADMGQLSSEVVMPGPSVMERAYEAAIWARPDIRAQQLADQQQEAKEKRNRKPQPKRNGRVSKDRAFAAGPGGSPAATVHPNSSVREDLEAAFAEAQGRI